MSVATWRRAAFTARTGWTLAMLQAWWQHYSDYPGIKLIFKRANLQNWGQRIMFTANPIWQTDLKHPHQAAFCSYTRKKFCLMTLYRVAQNRSGTYVSYVTCMYVPVFWAPSCTFSSHLSQWFLVKFKFSLAARMKHDFLQSSSIYYRNSIRLLV